ncbi:MAG: flagellar export protein FliJ [Syntrophales bacterium]
MFVFRLQSVLEHRKNMEEKAQCEFSAATVKLRAERTTMAALRDEETLLGTQWRNLAGQPAKAPDFGLYADYIKRVQQSIREQATVVRAAEEAAERKRSALLAVVKERKMLETLKEKQRLAYESWVAGREQRMLDEVSILKFKWEES